MQLESFDELERERGVTSREKEERIPKSLNLERESPSKNEFLVNNHPFIPLACNYQNTLRLKRI